MNSFKEITEKSKKKSLVSITYEEIGLFPRSFNRVFDRFLKQLFSDVENLVVQEYRFYRYLFLTTIRCLLTLIFVPIFVNFLAKNYLVEPLTKYYWNTKQSELFLNSYQQEQAFSKLQEFEERIYFESLIDSNCSQNQNSEPGVTSLTMSSQSTETPLNNEKTNSCHSRYLKQKLQDQTLELAIRYNNESIEGITNFFSDLISFSTLCFLLFTLEIQINITKSFLFELFFGLEDSKKSLLILFITDLLVGYHSPNLWETFFSSIFSHYGLPESETSIFLLVATLPVLLDVLFKYLIFRHLNRTSPATVATYHALIE
nr:chloroplast envelope membrane protein [Elakatothrix viridis]